MDYNKIIAVTGLPGLYEMLSSKNDGAIVRSLEDKSAKFVSNRIHNFSHLETIEIYTTNENMNLVDVFKTMQDNKTALPDAKDSHDVKKYFEKVLPTLDFERVYVSDMKKMVKWYEVLVKNNIEFKLTEEPVEEEAPAPVVKEAAKKETKKATTKVAEDKPVAEKKKPAAKKKAADETDDTKEVKEAPKKKAAPKKAAAKK